MNKIGMQEKRTNKLIKIVAVMVLLPLAVAVPLIGFEGGVNHSIHAQTQSESLQQRIANYKKSSKKKITGSDEKKIQQRCSVVKANLKNLSTRVKTVRTNRNASYVEIEKQLDTLYDRLEVQAFETTELKSNLDVLYSKMADFRSSSKNYEQALADMDDIDCTKKPIDFIVTLDAARRYQTELITLVADIRSEVANTIKPSLLKVKKQIQDGQTVGGEKQ